MSASERTKGIRGEQAVARIFREADMQVEQLQRNERGNTDMIVDGFMYVDSKAQERLQMPMWLRQARANAPKGAVPVVAFRQSRGEWYACLPLDDLVRLAQ